MNCELLLQSFDIQDLASSWARKRRLRVAAVGHGLICKETRSILVVDFVFERQVKRKKRVETSVQYALRSRKQGIQAKNQCFLASVYYAPTRSACQGRSYAEKYMKMVQRVCTRDMDFHPTVMVMCIVCGQGEGDGAKVYAKDVGGL